jgi:hypothetical protein
MSHETREFMGSATTDFALQAEQPIRRWAALAAAIGFSAIAIFQCALALGAPFGRASWGGTYEQLPSSLRIASAVAVGIWLLATWIVLRRAGFRVGSLVPLPAAFASWGTWALVGMLPLAALLNFASSSQWERFLWGPLSLTLAVLCFLLARSGGTIRRQRQPDTRTR